MYKFCQDDKELIDRAGIVIACIQGSDKRIYFWHSVLLVLWWFSYHFNPFLEHLWRFLHWIHTNAYIDNTWWNLLFPSAAMFTICRILRPLEFIEPVLKLIMTCILWQGRQGSLSVWHIGLQHMIWYSQCIANVGNYSCKKKGRHR